MSDKSPLDKIETVRNTLATLLVMSFILTLPMFVLVSIPKSNEQIITYMVGQLSGMATLALGFYFVSKVGQDAMDAKRAENTGKVLDLANATASIAVTDPPVDVHVVNDSEQPVPIVEEGKS